MTIKAKYDFGDSLYIKHDPEQREYELIGIVVRPGNIAYELSYLGEIIEMYDFQISDTRDEVKLLGLDKKEIE